MRKVLKRSVKFLPVIFTVAVILFTRYQYGHKMPSNEGHYEYWDYASQVFPSASFTSHGDREGCENVYDAEGNLLGTLVSSETTGNDIKGYAGPTPVLIAITPEEVIVGIKTLPSKESRNFISKVERSGFLEGFLGYSMSDAARRNVDAVTGATFTSRALARTITHAASVYSSVPEISEGNSSFGKEEIITLFIILAAVIAALTPLKGWGLLRTFVLLVSFLWFGILKGELISLERIVNWTVRGGSPQGAYGLLLVAVFSVVVSILFGKSLYCRYICPFGALQEFAGLIKIKKIKIPPSTFAVLARAKYILLLSAAGTLMFFPSADLSVMEPFKVFAFRTAGLFVFLFAGFFVFLSIFFCRPWCCFFCPTGAFLEIFRKKR